MTNYQTAFSIEKADWLDALEELLHSESPQNIADLLGDLQRLAARKGFAFSHNAFNTSYLNTIPVSKQPIFDGDELLEQKIENAVRWNALAMVLQANDRNPDLGGHLSTFAGAATMMEVAFNHFLRNKTADYGGDLLFIQGHASPGVYARAFLEGRISAGQLANFRRELQEGGGLPSYPHPRRLPHFWQAPSVSMGLGPLMAIQQARFAKYLENRALKPQNGGKIWCFIGDGEMSEPEIMGSVAIATREKLDNLIFVLHVNLVRLDGPIDANGKIIQTFESQFLGAGWDVIKVIFSSEWDKLFEMDTDGKLLNCLNALRDGDFQYISTLTELENADEIRQIIAQGDRSVLTLLSTLSDEEIVKLKRGGNDPKKVYTAYNQAVKATKPTVILMHTVKGYSLGSIAEGKNTAHQTKKIDKKSRISLARKYEIPISDEAAERADFYLPDAECPEMRYLHRRRYELGGYFPQRPLENSSLPKGSGCTISMPSDEVFEKVSGGTVSTTQFFVRLLKNLMSDASMGKYIVPITPDESQTFGLHSLFEKFGIYNPEGQQYHTLKNDAAKYVERRDGQILQEGINEAGALATFAAAGSAYSLHDIPTIPFYIFYSIFGFQRVGDLIYAAADMLCKGFLIGATAGRTTLNGEGLQHQDGHSPLLAATIPSVVTYDPAFGYELSAIVKSGFKRMFIDDEKLIFYILAYNESYKMPEISLNTEGVNDGILHGLYRFRKSDLPFENEQKVHLFGSGSIMQQVLAAADILEKMGISTDVWSATSYTELTRDCMAVERRNLLKNKGEVDEKSYFEQLFTNEKGIIVAVSDYMKALPYSIAKWSPLDFTALGTDGFGLSETRETLRDWFEISPKFIVSVALKKVETELAL